MRHLKFKYRMFEFSFIIRPFKDVYHFYSNFEWRLHYKDYSEQIFDFFKKNITDIKRIIEKD